MERPPGAAKAALIDALVAALGQPAVQVPSPVSPLREHLHDWRDRYHGRALAVVRPGSTEEVALAVRLCAAHGVSLVPQGGNTSLVGGSVPDASGDQVVLSLKRLNRIRQVDVANLSMTADAGCVLADVQAAAEAQGLLFPLSLASEGSCTVGGVLATNAGGTQVLRYGTARELCLGLEAVTAGGEVWHGLKALRKDNTGYDLRDLLIGSEGTLAVITAATLRLHPRPRGVCTALLGCPSPEAALSLLGLARQSLDAGLTACELMAPRPLTLVQAHLPGVTQALQGLRLPRQEDLGAGRHALWWVLLESNSTESEGHARDRMQAVLENAQASAWVQDGALAHNQAQRAAMWALREAIPLAERTEGKMVKHDIGVPTSSIPVFIERVERDLITRWPGCHVVCFGHLGDGNLHFNVQPPATAASGSAFEGFEQAVNAIVFDAVGQLGGTISAEHGIGELRKHELARRQSPVGQDMMRAIKQALDPQGVLNPGRVVVTRPS